ncbi:MAG: Ig-like domain-containing protein, partial [Methylophilaceae bacterium]|nr:Ig-like domain-containing protein [Methylophilaceae bacterium]
MTQNDASGTSDVSPAVIYTLDQLAPTVGTVAITASSSTSNNFLMQGGVVTATVELSEIVYLRGNSANTLLALNIGGTVVQASYLGGSDTRRLSFIYTILAGQNDINGISIPSNGLQLGDATLTDVAGNLATLNFVSVTDNPLFLVDTTPPAAPRLRLGSDAGISASDNLTNIPTLLVDGLEPLATWVYQVDNTAAGAWVSVVDGRSSFTAMSGTHTYFTRQIDAAGNTGAISSAVVYTLDQNIPTITAVSLTATRNASAAGALVEDDQLNVRVTVSHTVNVTDMPFYIITLNGSPRVARYNAALSTNTRLEFTYTIIGGDSATLNNIIAIARGLVVGSAEISDNAGNKLNTTSALTNSLNSTISTTGLDITSPVVVDTFISAASDIQNRYLKAGSVVTVSVLMSEAVTVNTTLGTPVITLNIGSLVRIATYAGGSGSNLLTFTYTISINGDNTDSGIGVAVNATGSVITLNGASITDVATNPANLAYHVVASNPNYLVDTIAPSIPTLILASDTGSSASDRITSNPTIFITSLENTTAWQYKVDSGSWQIAVRSSFTASQGAHSYQVQQTDLAGNV